MKQKILLLKNHLLHSKEIWGVVASEWICNSIDLLNLCNMCPLEWEKVSHASPLLALFWLAAVIVINHDSRNSDELLMGQNDM